MTARTPATPPCARGNRRILASRFDPTRTRRVFGFRSLRRSWNLRPSMLVLLVGSALMATPPACIAGTATATLQVGSAATTSGTPVIVPLTVDLGSAMLGAASLRVAYDPDVVSAIGCNVNPAGSLPASALVLCNPALDADKSDPDAVGLSLVIPTGTSGRHVLANLEFESVGTVHSNTVLGIEVLQFTDPSAGPVAVSALNGTIEVVEAATPTSPIPAATPTFTATPTQTVVTELYASRAVAQRGEHDVAVDVRTSKAIVVGGADITVRFDPVAVQAVSVSSNALPGLASQIDNANGEVRATWSAGSGVSLADDEALFQVLYDVDANAPRGPVTIELLDEDSGVPPLLFGTSPPSPPSTIRTVTRAGALLVGAGDVSCNDELSAYDAALVLCSFVGSCPTGSFVGECTEQSHREVVSDWDCNQTLDSVDALFTLGLVTGTATPSGSGLFDGCMGGSGSAIVRTKRLSLDVREISVGSAEASPGERIEIPVLVLGDVEFGATDIFLRFDPRMLRAMEVHTPISGLFVHSIDNQRGAVRTASASERPITLRAGERLFSVVFVVKEGNRRRRSYLRLFDGDHIGGRDITPPLRNGFARTLPVRFRRGEVRLRDSGVERPDS